MTRSAGPKQRPKYRGPPTPNDPKKRLRQTRLNFSSGSAPPSDPATPPRPGGGVEVVIWTPPKSPPPETPVKKDSKDLGEGEEKQVVGVPEVDMRSSPELPKLEPLSAAPDLKEGMVPLTSSTRKRIKKVSFADVDDEDDDEPVPSSAIKRGKKKIRLESDSESSDIDMLPLLLSQPQELSNMAAISSSDEDDEILPSSSTRRRHIRKRALPPLPPPPPPPLADPTDPDDLKDDLLLAEKTPTFSTRTRLAGSAPKLTSYQKKLLALKAARAARDGGNPPTSPIITPDDTEESGPWKALYDTETSSDPGSSPVADDDDGEHGEHATTDARATAPLFPPSNDGDEDEDMSDFIVPDDPESLLGAPDDPTASIPLEFTAASHQTPKSNFVTFCTHLVLSLLFPGTHDPKPDKRVLLSLRRLDDLVTSYRSSILQSSVWKSELLDAMKLRPEFHDSVLGVASNHCDACNRDRYARHKVWFSGQAYDVDTLLDTDKGADGSDPEEGESRSGSEDSEEDESGGENEGRVEDKEGAKDQDEHGRTRNFFLGSTCYLRTKLSHAFWHWKKHLRQRLETELELLKVLSNSSSPNTAEPQLVEPFKEMVAGWTPEQAEKWAQKIAENELGDEIERLYHDFKDAMEKARDTMSRMGRGEFGSSGRRSAKSVAVGSFFL